MNHVLAVLALHIVNVFFLFIIGGGSYEVESPNGDGQSRRSVSERSQEGLGAELARTSRTCREYCALDHRSNSGE